MIEKLNYILVNKEIYYLEILKDYKGKYIAVILNPRKGIHTPLKEAIIGVRRDALSIFDNIEKIAEEIDNEIGIHNR